MRKIIRQLWSSAFLLCLLAANGQVTHTTHFNSNLLQLVQAQIGGNDWVIPAYEGLRFIDESDMPCLPYKIETFSVPCNASNFQLSIAAAQFADTGLNGVRIIPVERPVGESDGEAEPLTADTATYHSNTFYPQFRAEIIGDGFYGGENHVVSVAVYPLQYNPVAGVARFWEECGFTISYDLPDNPPLNIIPAGNQQARQRLWDEVRAVVQNPQLVETNAPTQQMLQRIQVAPADSAEAQSNFSLDSEYLIVAENGLIPSFRKLAALKRQKGYTVKVVGIGDVLAHHSAQAGDIALAPNGDTTYITDNAGKLRQYLKWSFANEGTRYLLIGGKGIPFRYGYHMSLEELQNKCNIPTDLYFSELTTNWNIDGDALYGEHSLYDRHGAHFDMMPELYVGRLMAENASDIDNYTQKLLRYELNPGRGNTSYLSRSLITFGSTEQRFRDESKVYPKMYSVIAPDTVVIHQPTTTYPSGIDVINLMNASPLGLMSIHGHGTPHEICVNGIFKPKKSHIRNFDKYKQVPHTMGLDKMSNKYSPAVFYSISCTNMPFDTYEDYTNRNLGQSFTLGKDYGGVAYLGNTRTGTSRCDSTTLRLDLQALLEKYFIDCLTTGVCNAGKAEAMSKAKYGFRNGGDLRVTMTHNLMGEPEFEVWTAQPTSFSGICVNRSDGGITISGLSVGDTVGVCSNSGAAYRRTATSGSTYISHLSPNSTVMVYRHNHLPYIAPLVLQNTTIAKSQYVIASDVVAGSNVDSNRTAGEVTIAAGVDYEIEYKDSVTLGPGFCVEEGATLEITPSDY